MGCGKSTVGRNLARKTGKRFVDMDAYIEKKTGKTISEIFTDQGEDGFRDIEHEVCLELADKSNLIIATGGGALTFERNVRVFKGKDIIPDKNKAMTELYNKRYPLYKAASDVTVKGKNTPIQTTRAVMDAVRHFSLDYSDLK